MTTRLKKSTQIIRLVRPMELTPSDLIYPIFVRENGRQLEIPSMKGQKYLSLEDTVKICNKVLNLRIPAVMICAILEKKNADGSIALKEDNFNLEIFRKLKKEFNDELVLISNICLCTFTEDEYCVYSEKGRVLNEKTAKMLGRIAVAHAEAGADVIAPAAMADGQVKYIRLALDEKGLDNIPIMSYIKTDSCLFQPFFEAVSLSEVPRVHVDSSKFRIDIINAKMFMQRLQADINEGADIVIIKPALTNLDLIHLTKETYPMTPIAAYQVSGEYRMMNALAEQSSISENTLIMETLLSIKRAGADMILTYYALKAAQLLKQKN